MSLPRMLVQLGTFDRDRLRPSELDLSFEKHVASSLNDGESMHPGAVVRLLRAVLKW